MDLEDVKNTIESFNKNHQIEILRIIQQCSASIINENKNGIYINMTFLKPDTITHIKEYIAYVQDQEKMLKPMESQKEDFKNTFFIDKEVNPLLSTIQARSVF